MEMEAEGPHGTAKGRRCRRRAPPPPAPSFTAALLTTQICAPLRLERTADRKCPQRVLDRNVVDLLAVAPLILMKERPVTMVRPVRPPVEPVQWRLVAIHVLSPPSFLEPGL